MIVVADAGPLQYLVRIGTIDVLAPLYQRVLVPQTVAGNYRTPIHRLRCAPGSFQPPPWSEIQQVDPPADAALGFLDAGERAAITLALSIGADRLLVDDLAGRLEAERRQLSVTGTLGVLGDAHLAGLLDFESALA